VVTLGSIPDLLRLLAVPVFAWTAYRDIKTRRVPNRTWLPLLGLGILALLVESYLVWTGGTVMPVDPQVFLIQVVVSVGLIVPLAYAFWWIGGFGGADAKALITLAVLFPTFPTYFLPGVALPLVEPTVGVFSLTVLSNTVVAGIAYPFALAARNAIAGRFSKVMFFGRPIRWDDATEEYGRLLETPDGFTRQGLDLDALRMYLNWRGATLAEVRADPDRHRDPTSIPAETNPPGDGAIPVTDGGHTDETTDGIDADETATESEPHGTAGESDPDEPAVADPWGAEQFLESIDGSAYGTSPEELREGLDVLTEEEVVWITPGIPFLVPMFVGLLVGLTYGDVIFALLGVGGLA
jgi:preflagellin peptidase FlaK